MAVGRIIEFKGSTLDEYDQILEKMGLEPGGKTPPGAIFHWAGATDDGWLAVDVWEDRETFDKFTEEKIGPISAEVGAPQPTITEYEVHNMLAR